MKILKEVNPFIFPSLPFLFLGVSHTVRGGGLSLVGGWLIVYQVLREQ